MRRLLDLFSGAGGAATGYFQAGFTEIVGVDIRPMPRYPFPFVQADALEFLHGVNYVDFDMIHASPPCQKYSVATPRARRHEHADLLAETRRRLQQTGIAYVIENVGGGPVAYHVTLCGLMFGLKVFRHRLFETSELLFQPEHPHHAGHRIGRGGFCTVAGGGNSVLRDRRSGKNLRRRAEDGVNGWRRATEIDWMTRDELAQAIPPAYTRWVGEQMRSRL